MSKFIGVYLFNLLIAIILTLTLIGTITDSIESTLAQIIVGMFIIITIYGILSALIPILVHKAVSPGWSYTEWNESYYIRLPREENYKYYSKWYLDLLGVKEFYYKRDNGEEVKEKNISWAFQAEVKRPEDVNHWKNQLLTNRPLTILEYKKLKKLDKESEIRKQEDLEEYKQYNSN
ncbi:hypothetical protein JSa36_171 [Staphylococcus phage J-Sa36]|uniref:MbpJ n=1 Tax=Staphylococcus phage J-Sa36 TaxID=2508849 RepID=A0A410TAX5_BPPGK|nr:hypothetical protein JSa36_171 [Staphylococcus phage J-Sa36]